jgi:hypothetical protein
VVKRNATLAAAAVALGTPALAHHADTGLDLETVVTFHGTVTEFDWRNPHSYVSVQSAEGGEQLEWEVQLGAAAALSRRGMTRDTLQVGDEVVVSLNPARDGRPYGLVASIIKDGVDVSGRNRRFDDSTRQSDARTTTIEGVWFVDRASLGDYAGGLEELADELSLTAKGQAAADAFDQNSEENPVISCTTRPAPAGIVYTDFYPMEIEFVNDDITMIRSQFFDQERTVYMDGRAHPSVNERFHEGHSVGRWEGDVLVVDTTNFAVDRSAYQNGVPSGDQKHVVERYRLHEDGTRMTAEFRVEDPEYFVGTFTHSRDLIYSPHLEMTPYNCDPEASRRYLGR